ncbi:MAG: hypothetical protein FWH20_00250 [Oscillospiraceae bacterium]|nr:hypothetical protein [Oscillospiraceae bacterium]
MTSDYMRGQCDGLIIGLMINGIIVSAMNSGGDYHPLIEIFDSMELFTHEIETRILTVDGELIEIKLPQDIVTILNHAGGLH